MLSSTWLCDSDRRFKDLSRGGYHARMKYSAPPKRFSDRERYGGVNHETLLMEGCVLFFSRMEADNERLIFGLSGLSTLMCLLEDTFQLGTGWVADASSIVNPGQ